MTEDEEWAAAELQLHNCKIVAARLKAVEAAERLCKENIDCLHIFTIRKAFELGYMEAHKDG